MGQSSDADVPRQYEASSNSRGGPSRAHRPIGVGVSGRREVEVPLSWMAALELTSLFPTLNPNA